jgi:hypothetical protein
MMSSRFVSTVVSTVKRVRRRSSVSSSRIATSREA